MRSPEHWQLGFGQSSAVEQALTEVLGKRWKLTEDPYGHRITLRVDRALRPPVVVHFDGVHKTMREAVQEAAELLKPKPVKPRTAALLNPRGKGRFAR